MIALHTLHSCMNCLHLFEQLASVCPNCGKALCDACVALLEQDKASRHQKAGCFGY